MKKGLKRVKKAKKESRQLKGKSQQSPHLKEIQRKTKKRGSIVSV